MKEEGIDEELESHLAQLLNRLEEIGADHAEISDTAVREKLGEAMYRTFVLEADDTVPEDFGMFEDEGNEAVHEALKAYVDAALPIARELNLDEEERKTAVWTFAVTSEEGVPPADFFGPRPP